MFNVLQKYHATAASISLVQVVASFLCVDSVEKALTKTALPLLVGLTVLGGCDIAEQSVSKNTMWITETKSEKPLGEPWVVGIEWKGEAGGSVYWKVFDAKGKMIMKRQDVLQGTACNAKATHQCDVELFNPDAAFIQVHASEMKTPSVLKIARHQGHHSEMDRSWWWNHLSRTKTTVHEVLPGYGGRGWIFDIHTLEPAFGIERFLKRN